VPIVSTADTGRAHDGRMLVVLTYPPPEAAPLERGAFPRSAAGSATC
jgi:hypothetical protein